MAEKTRQTKEISQTEIGQTETAQESSYMAQEADLVMREIRGLQKLHPRVFVAVDGRCGAGKTTLAQEIRKQTGCALFHMDDFYLRMEQRTKERYEEPGGNVDRERFLEEVLTPLKTAKDGEILSYRPFLCGKWVLGDPISEQVGSLIVVEGSYSCHPELFDRYDLHVFVDIDPQTQQERILRRNGAEKLEMFKNRWIPMEEAYFSAFGIREKCEIQLNGGR
ncbi:uridine kinase family protein [Brotaphodocola sp.]|uniref:uridine kinase family protein n=1 Tax=Brotaphodocola sp. TaxID=3073577 RepID=UPI003D7CF466